MSIDRKQVSKIASLARIEITEEDMEYLEEDLNSILKWVEQLNSVNTEGILPLTSVVKTDLQWRDDIVNDGGYPEIILENAPKSEDDYFLVPKIVE